VRRLEARTAAQVAISFLSPPNRSMSGCVFVEGLRTRDQTSGSLRMFACPWWPNVHTVAHCRGEAAIRIAEIAAS